MGVQGDLQKGEERPGERDLRIEGPGCAFLGHSEAAEVG